MRAFGPYATEQVIDFRELSGSNLFLIHGPTGSGKTTILDAICFALYGESSGHERKGKDVRSHLAASDCRTEVTLDYTLGERAWRVVRSLEYVRPSRRGSGSTTEPAAAALWDRTGCRSDEDEGTNVATRPSDTDRWIIDQLGFRAAEFRQVVVLPQGEFRKLLTIAGTDRGEILKRLFPTERFAEAEEAINAAAKRTRTKWEACRQHQAGILSTVDADNVDELNHRLAETAESHQTTKEMLAGAVTASQAAAAELEKAAALVRLVAEREAAVVARDAELQRAGEMELNTALLTAATRAAQLTDVLKMGNDAVTRVERCRRDLAAAEVAEAKAVQRAEEAAAAHRRELDRAPEREALEAKARELERLIEVCEALAKASVDEGCKRASRDEAAARVEQLCSQMKRLKGQHDEAEARVQVDARLAERTEELRLIAEGARRRQQELSRLTGMRKDLAQARERLASAELVRSEAAGKARHAEAHWEQLHRRMLAGQAASLASRLTPGEPCLVCGSAEHPSPATSTEQVPTESAVEHAHEVAVAARKAVADLDAASAGESARLDSLRKSIADLEELYPEVAASTPTQLSEAARVADHNLTLAVQAAARVEKSRAALEGVRLSLTAGEEQLVQAQEQLRLREDELLTASALALERGRSIPSDLRPSGAVEKALSDHRSQILALRSKFENAALQARASDSLLAAARSTASERRENLATAEKEQSELIADLLARIRSAGFAAEADVRAAMRPAAEMDRLQAEIAAHKERLAAATQRLDRAVQQVGDRVAPDLSPLREAAEHWEQTRTSLIAEEATRRARLTTLATAREKLLESMRESETLERRLSLEEALADLAKGARHPKVSFSRFVLARYLDLVLASASERLRRMSGGRYRLERQTEGQDRRVAAGLEIIVHDVYSGSTRAVQTLSGGESFLASLALALGLADVVQQVSGGISLETVFVDEGFSSLDSESLESAIESLRELQAGRLVGIISHVTELKEWIDAQLIVETDRGRSSAHFRA